MILADQLATGVNWMLLTSIVMTLATVGMWLDSRKQRKTTLEQPVDVRLVKALHEEFAHKAEFDQLVSSNTQRHAQLFGKMETLEREARALINHEIPKLNTARTRTMEKLNEQFTFIRESLSAINTELKLNRERNE